MLIKQTLVRQITYESESPERFEHEFYDVVFEEHRVGGHQPDELLEVDAPALVDVDHREDGVRVDVFGLAHHRQQLEHLDRAVFRNVQSLEYFLEMSQIGLGQTQT